MNSPVLLKGKIRLVIQFATFKHAILGFFFSTITDSHRVWPFHLAQSGKPVAITGPALTGRRSKAGPAPAPPRALGVALTAQLRGLAETFLTEAYAILMTEMKRKVEAVVGYERDRSTDLQRYMRVVAFFTAFVRLRTEQATASTPNADPPAESPFATISATFCHPTVNFLFRNWTVQMSEALKSPDKDWELQVSLPPNGVGASYAFDDFCLKNICTS
jgi:hypothetical protein